MEQTKKNEDMSNRIKELKDLKHEIEMSLGGELIEIIKHNRGLSFDFSVLVGGVVDVIEKAKSDSSVIAEWKAVGDAVRKSEGKLPSDFGKNTTPTRVS